MLYNYRTCIIIELLSKSSLVLGKRAKYLVSRAQKKTYLYGVPTCPIRRETTYLGWFLKDLSEVK